MGKVREGNFGNLSRCWEINCFIVNMKKGFVLLILFGGFLFVVGAGCRKDIEQSVNEITGLEPVRIEQQAEKDLAIAKAQNLFKQKVAAGEDMSNGPCLADEIIPDWSADLLHDPREEVDDLEENQCQFYHEGKTHHYVELDMNGNLIRAE